MSHGNALFPCLTLRSPLWRPSVCEVTSWLDWWLSTCGSFREHLTDEERGNFERLMLSGLRALEFLGDQGVSTLGSLVLSCRDSLLLDVRSTVPADEVARLCYADLPSSSGLFPSPLLDSALDKMRTASNNALVQRTLHPPKIPWKSSAGPSKAGSSSASSADCGGASPVVPRSQKQASTGPPPLPLPSRVRSSGDTKARRPFQRFRPLRWQKTRCREKVLLMGSRLCCGWRVCLSAHWRHWQTVGAESWVLSVLRDGYRIPFKDSSPPLAHTKMSFLTYRAGSPQSLALHQEVEKMLSRDALEIVLDPGPGFYSHLFLVEKVTRGWRPVIDLSHPNEFVLQTPFQMETVASVLLSVREGDFLAFIDLKDAYIQIPIHQSSRKLLRFLSEGTVYQFKALCFGLSTAPQVFTRVFAAVSAIRLLGYLDDWLVLASLETSAKKNVQDLLSLCHSLVPSQTANYLGMTIDTGAARIFPSHARVEKFLLVADTFCTMSALAGGFRTPGFAGEVGSSQSTLNALSAEAFEDALVSRVGFSLPPGTSVPGGDTGSGSTPVLRRVSVGMGHTPPRPCSIQGVVGAGEVAHQSS